MIEKNCSFNPSKHAKDKMIETGVEKNEIIHAILNGAKVILHNKILARLNEFEVIYRQLPCHYFIITVYIKNK